MNKPVIPLNPTNIFIPHLKSLKDIYAELANEPDTQSKQQFWLEMLHVSGSAPESEDDQSELFISHTLIVTIARAVIDTLSDSERSKDLVTLVNPVNIMANSFASWLHPSDKGIKWTLDVFDTVDTYDWRPETRDVLRNVHQELIPKEQRKALGEFYTPDWMAGMLAERILDDEWIENAVEKYLYNDDVPQGVGMLDPSCGSGTFLYHSARHILNSEALQRENATPQQQADFIARMVNGIDIHPVSVEISRATLMRALPVAPSNGVESLYIYQGDALMTPRNPENVAVHEKEEKTHQTRLTM